MNSEMWETLFKMPKKIFNIAGIWTNRSQSLFTKLRCWFFIFFWTLIIISLLKELFSFSNDFEIFSEKLLAVLTMVHFYFKVTIFVINGKKFVELRDHMKKSIFSSHPYELIDYNMVNRTKSTKKIMDTYIGFCFVTVFIYCLKPLIEGKTLIVSLPVEIPPKYNIIVFIGQAIFLTAAQTINSNFDTLNVALMSMVTAQLKTLNSMILHSKQVEVKKRNIQYKDDLETLQVLKHCTNLHIEIIR